ncbi:MAG: hypothetical protein LC667_10920 [Thioalkalivibrio sp.]|nr:hypothetical protein [Thioalkalivibrio sp.]
MFAIFYITLAMVLSVFISRSWLLAVGAAHILLEWLKKGYLGSRSGMHRTVWTLCDDRLDTQLTLFQSLGAKLPP